MTKRDAIFKFLLEVYPELQKTEESTGPNMEARETAWKNFIMDLHHDHEMITWFQVQNWGRPECFEEEDPRSYYWSW